MKSYLIVFMINSFLTYEFLVRLSKRLPNSLKRRGFYLAVFLILLLHVCTYFFTKSPNFFEKMEMPRSNTISDLKRSFREMKIKYHPDKVRDTIPNAEEKFIELREIYEVLSDKAQKTIYDKYGLKNEKIGTKLDENTESEFLIFSLVESGMIYIVFFIFGIILTYDENVQASRKWFLLIVMLSAGVEGYYYFGKNLEEEDWFDFWFVGRLACFERLELLRFVVGFLANAVRAKYRVFNKVVFDMILEQNEEILSIQRQIQSLISRNQAEPHVIKMMVERVKDISGDVYNNVEKEVQKREEMKKKVGWLKKITKWLVIILMIVGVYNQFFKSKDQQGQDFPDL